MFTQSQDWHHTRTPQHPTTSPPLNIFVQPRHCKDVDVHHFNTQVAIFGISMKDASSVSLAKDLNVFYLIACLEDYKSEMDYENVGFISDVIALFSRIRKRIAFKFVVELPNK